MKKSLLRTLAVALVVFASAGTINAAPDKVTEQESDLQVTPAIRYVGVSGDEEKFREDQWMKNDVTGGLNDLTFRRKLSDDANLEFMGRAIFDDGDYKIRFNLTKKDVGFVNAGFTQFRKYFDGTGGFEPRFTMPSVFELNRRMHLDIGNLFINVGITLPKWPTIVLGYERQYKDGDKSYLEWGGVTEPAPADGLFPTGSVTKKIYPSYKSIDETVDIFKADVEHDVSNVHLANNFRLEHYRNSTFRYSQGGLAYNSSGTVTADKSYLVDEHFKHDMISNTFYMDSHVNDKVYWSAGYMFNNMNGGAEYLQDTMVLVGSSSSRDKYWSTLTPVDLHQDTHLLNVNALFGPFKKLSLNAGIQAEKTRTDSFGMLDILELSAGHELEVIGVTNNKDVFTENLGAKYTGLPWTTVYAEARWTQSNIDLAMDGLITDIPYAGSLSSQTTETELHNADIRNQRYTIGFSSAPISRVTVTGQYRHGSRNNGYRVLGAVLMEEGTYVGGVFTGDGTVEGEPAESYITRQKFITDEVSVKVGMRVNSQVRCVFKYQMVSTDIKTTALGGEVLAGDYCSNIYSVAGTWAPVNRLYLTGLFSCQQTDTHVNNNGLNAVVPYKGDVYTILANGAYGVNDKTDLSITYTFSWSRNFVNNSSGMTAGSDYGYPYRVTYDQHGLNIGLTRRVRENISVALGYGFYNYNETSNGGIDNYTAHLFGGQCTIRF